MQSGAGSNEAKIGEFEWGVFLPQSNFIFFVKLLAHAARLEACGVPRLAPAGKSILFLEDSFYPVGYYLTLVSENSLAFFYLIKICRRQIYVNKLWLYEFMFKTRGDEEWRLNIKGKFVVMKNAI
ncbi:hypothetical protein JTF06_07070 [Desemzia sp. RIT804]|uniref:hypothetical protein n=1 Tax=Desemzia sp. RIT 804 TaxID=2810209 RepID=UPI001950D4C4|nr:hypothetical protein [Desemzia sp. RIT 804]MBM6614648.1 hypothetical protein [Desemzia sp. RIT 804]